MKFVIFHGSFGSKDGNWFPDLKNKLENFGQEVILPQYPVEDWDKFSKQDPQKAVAKKQNLTNWLNHFERNVLPKINRNDKLCFVGHSLGPLFILHVVEKFKLQLDSAIFVSPTFGIEKGKTLWQFDVVNDTFNKHSFDFEKLKRLIPVSYVLYSDNDPFIDVSSAKLFGKAMDSSLIFVRRASHMNLDTVNLNEFPLVFDLCCTRLDLPLYQKFLARHSQLQASEYIRKNQNKVIKLAPKDANDEGRFHFMNLKKGGFCTLVSSSTNLNPYDQYYEDGRKTAKNCKITRVIMVVNDGDLKRKEIKEQIKLDLQAGIKVGLCKLKDVENKIGEYDFGLWDDEYICSIHYKNFKKQSEIILDGRHESLEKARNWRETILQNTKIIKPK